MKENIRIQETIDNLDNAISLINNSLKTVDYGAIALTDGEARSILRTLRSQKEAKERELFILTMNEEETKAALIHVIKGCILYHAHCSLGLVVMVVPWNHDEGRSFSNVEDATKLTKYITGFIPKKSSSTF